MKKTSNAHNSINAKLAPPQPVVDYRQFRPRLINDPRFSHLKLLAGWMVYFAFYFLTEKLIPAEDCHVIHCALDDMIPFSEYFIVFYCAWFVWIIGTLLYFLLYDIDSFKHLQTLFIIIQAIAVVIYIVYPSIQLGRPTTFEHSNVFTWLTRFIYGFDTPTGVCPSVHAAYSFVIAFVWLRRKESSAIWKVFMVGLCVMICVSTVLVKQHSVIDIVVAVPVALVAEFLLYGRVGNKRSLLEELLEKI